MGCALGGFLGPPPEVAACCHHREGKSDSVQWASLACGAPEGPLPVLEEGRGVGYAPHCACIMCDFASCPPPACAL